MQEFLEYHKQLAPDEYVQYVDAYYRAALSRFGRHWKYLDISNVLFTAARILQPSTYLEIGVRRGRSACMVARGCPTVNMVAFDMWVTNYAGMENPGETFVRKELLRHGHTGTISFVDGDSHQTVPAFFKNYPDTFLDMITVDGDHSEEGAFDDLCNVIPHLSVGGIIVFDDISHPAHPYLLNVWRKAIAKFPNLAGYEYTEAGFGVAFAIRRS
jgi:predicted O-methyltransferase YrrM